MNVYIKSAIYLTVCGGIGYVLLEVTKPNKEKIAKINENQAPIAYGESAKKKALFMQKLREASESKDPIYIPKQKDQ
ncbi:uncharacterized protein LOC129744402 [Uranotaenia lowii]|uniref:uncharacterized protein LOC129744402 n=1 Tax=Uranotaenia lowii TaxID=190385 RepID=UPI0024797D48|nr:uncharacterized protein LOC129744402 [Uranotaenia lowii]